MAERNWPAWYYGPKGAAAVFESQSEVPEGWVDHPSKVGQPAAAPSEPVGGPVAPSQVVDASGVPWDASINTANRAQTVAGLWQLLPGKSRPAPATIDL